MNVRTLLVAVGLGVAAPIAAFAGTAIAQDAPAAAPAPAVAQTSTTAAPTAAPRVLQATPAGLAAAGVESVVCPGIDRVLTTNTALGDERPVVNGTSVLSCDEPAHAGSAFGRDGQFTNGPNRNVVG